MSETYVTVAGFGESVKAEIARGRLESEGIPVFLSGDLTANTFSGFGSVGGSVELRVPAEHLARAIRILGECGATDNLTDEVRAGGHDEGPMWVCSLCGDVVRAVLPLCPACHTPRGSVADFDPDDDSDDEPEEGIQSLPAGFTRMPRQRPEEGLRKAEDVTLEPSSLPSVSKTGIEVPSLRTMVGDAMARRAFYAALFSPLVGGILVLYSLWLLIKTGSYRGELSARGMRYLYLALVLDVLILLSLMVLCAGLPAY
jgi:Putative prokaryotic signal transducing protein